MVEKLTKRLYINRLRRLWIVNMNAKHEKTYLLKNTIILGIGSIGTKLINIIMLPFYTAWLTVYDYGVIDVYNALISALVPVLTLQLEQGMFRYLIDAETDKKKGNIIKTGGLTIGIVLLVSDIVSIIAFHWFNHELKYLFLVALNVNVIITTLLQIIRGIGNNKAYTINTIIVCIINLSLSILFVRYYQQGARGILIANIISTIVGIIYLIILVNKKKIINKCHYNLILLKRMLGYSLPMIVNNISWWVLNLSDKLLISIFLNTESNGIYAAAGKMSYIITSIYTVFSLAWQESASKASKNDKYEVFCGEIHKIVIDVCIHLTGIILVASPILYRVLINEKFSESYNHNIILVIAAFFWCIASFYGGIYVGLKKSSDLGWTSVITAVLNILINLLFINKIGIYAASISTLISYVILFIIRYIRINKSIILSISKIRIISIMLVIFGGSTVALLHNYMLSWILGGIYAVSYLIYLLKILKKIKQF